MGNSKRNVSLGFDHDEICEGQHICLLFRDDSERRRIISSFLSSGIMAGEKILYLVDTLTPSDFIEAMKPFGVDLSELEKELDLRQAESTYCPDGEVFDSDKMISTLRDYYLETQENGEVAVRGTGEMTWALSEGRTNKSELFKYEAKINLMQRDHPMTVCCQYDTNRFDANTIMDVLEVHPMMIVNEKLISNPMYIDPETFLEAQMHR